MVSGSEQLEQRGGSIVNDEQRDLNREVCRMLGVKRMFMQQADYDFYLKAHGSILTTSWVQIYDRIKHELVAEHFPADWSTDLNAAWRLQTEYQIEGVALMDIGWLLLPPEQAATEMVKSWLRWIKKGAKVLWAQS